MWLTDVQTEIYIYWISFRIKKKSNRRQQYRKSGNMHFRINILTMSVLHKKKCSGCNDRFATLNVTEKADIETFTETCTP